MQSILGKSGEKRLKKAKNKTKLKVSRKHNRSEDELSTASVADADTTVSTDSRRVTSKTANDNKTKSDTNWANFDSSFNIDPLFENLKSDNTQERQVAADKLKEALITISREISTEQFQRLSNTINNKIFELIHGSASNEKIGGILAVDSLIDFYLRTDELPNQTSRLANYLRVLIPSNDIEVMRLATQTLGKLALPRGTSTSEFVDFEVKTCLDWLTSSTDNPTLSSKQEYRKHAALMIVSALSDNSPYLLFPYVNPILDNIWLALRDTKLVIRMDAADTMRKCLLILQARDPSIAKEWYNRIFLTGIQGLSSNSNENIHATLLAFRQLLTLKGQYLSDKYSQIFQSTIKYKDHKYEVIRKEVYAIIPLLAAFDKKLFSTKYLDPTLVYYLKVLKDMDSNPANNVDKEAIFISIGDISEQVRSKIDPYTVQILTNIKQDLQIKYKIRKHYERALFYCISKMAIALGPALAANLNNNFLDLILSCPLSAHMQEVMATLKKYIPALSEAIDNRLLDILQAYMTGERSNTRNNLRILKPVSLNQARKWREKDICSKTGENYNDDYDEQVLSLVFKMIDIINPDMLSSDHIKLSIISYIEYNNSIIRKLAALVSCELYKKSDDSYNISDTSVQTASRVLSKLLVLAITDPNSSVRLELLQSLDNKFDSQLAQPDNLRLLFSAINDEIFEIRLEALRVVGKLCELNPIYAIPELQKVFLGFLTELEYANSTRGKEQVLTLLGTLMNSADEIPKPYIKQCLDILLIRLQDNSSAVATTTLKTIGILAKAVNSGIVEYIPKLMPIIISTLHNQTNSLKKTAAIRTLIELSRSTGYVVEPLIDYPELLSIVINLLKTETNPTIKQDIVQLIGTLGALDPYKHREIEGGSTTARKVEKNQHSTAIDLLIQGMSPANDEFYPSVVVHNLVKILQDPSLSSHHTNVVQTIIRVFQDLGLQCIVFLHIFVPAILEAMKSCPPSHLEFYFQQLSILVDIVDHYISPHIEEIFGIIKEFFPIVKLQLLIISLIESIAKAVKHNLRRFIPITLNLFLGVLENDKSNQKMASTAVLKGLVELGKSLEDYSQLIIPTVVRICEFSHTTLRKAAIVTLGKLAKTINLSEMASRIIHSMVRILENGDKALVKSTMNTLCLILLQLGNDFIVYIPVINHTLVKNRIQHSIYDQLVNKLMNGEVLNTNMLLDKDTENSKKIDFSNTPRIEKLKVDQQALKNVWDCSQQRTKEDWQEWFRRLSVQTIREASSPSLRACSNIVSIYNPLAKTLFNTAFSSCWNELQVTYKESILNSLCYALSSPENPPEIYQILINLVEFMEHDMNPLPIPVHIMGEYAQNCNAYAKALHYNEMEFIENEKPSIIESLININNQLHQTDTSIGILKYAQQKYNLQLKETWYEKLQRWDDALQAYTEREKAGEDSKEVMMGKLRSLFALGNWQQISNLARDKFNTVPLDVKEKMAPIAAGASWALQDWDEIEKYCSVLPDNSIHREFFSAVLCLHRNNFKDAEYHSDKASSLVVSEMSALVNESYSRIYNSVVKCQRVAELKEIIRYKQLPRDSPNRKYMRETWNKRLLGCQSNVDVWQSVLSMRTLVVSPEEDKEIWVKFANLCRKSGRMGMANEVLHSLLARDEMSENPNVKRASPDVMYAYLKYQWEAGSRELALDQLNIFISKVIDDLGLTPSTIISKRNMLQRSNIQLELIEDRQKLLSRCFVKQGDWTITIEPNWSIKNPDTILSAYLLATHFDSKWYKAWHKWALANFEVISMMTSTSRGSSVSTSKAPITSFYQITNNLFDKTNNSNGTEFSDNLINNHVVSAIKGFFHSIALSNSSLLQDALRLLTLWFTFGSTSETTQAMQEGFNMVEISTWLEVLPQLISHIHQRNPLISRSLLTLLSDLGKAHPQALVYPLTVAIKSDSVSRQKAAISIIEKMRSHSPILVDQAEVLSHELIRVVVLWNEMWYEGLEDASRQFFGENNHKKMLETLEPLHALLKRGPETLREISFKYAFGKDLDYAYKWVKKFKETGDVCNLNQAWDIYYSVFRKINKQLPQMESLELQHVSPKLLASKDLELAIPGTYIPGKPIIRLSSVEPICDVISSKQRPRKITFKGSDGQDYQYALKGHEDIRQDSLVMQLFGLVNTLLQNDIECFQRHLDIHQFPAIPLSPKTGLIGWVTESDTLHILIKEYRDSKKVPLNIEHLVMLQMAPDYDSLTLLQKVEVFDYVLDNTQGLDLYNVLWLKSTSSESWLERRTTYTRSLAVMSMTGYILGLGDRHPSNLMMNRVTGKIVHIDFGDCFEAAILREKYPEKVPFRLTRMLIKAMEVSGIEGSFRITCENVMRVLRDNKDSLMAILEAFAFDPLIRWGFDVPTDKIANEIGENFYINSSTEVQNSEMELMLENSTPQKKKRREYTNARAVLVLKRISSKLTGNDISKLECLDVADQVDHLIQQAQSVENLCQHYIGWCPFW